jgi:hypothetical protein
MLAAALAKHIAANVAGCTFDPDGVTGNVFIATMPSSPDLAVMINPVGGIQQADLTPERIPTPQILVRSARLDPRPGLTLAGQILATLDGLGRTVLDPAGPDETDLIGCTAMQSAPVALGADDNDRHAWSLNFTCPIWVPSALRPG